MLKPALDRRRRVCATRPSLLAALLVCLSLGDAAAAAVSYVGSALNPTGGTKATEQPIAILRVDHDAAAITIDGHLDEAVWRRLPAYDHMTVTTPDLKQPASYRTHTFLFYTEHGLYVGAWNEQPPDTLVSRLSGRDTFDSADAYQIVIDSSGNGLYGYWFRVKLGDSLMDGTLLPERRFESNWDGPWRAKTRKTVDGWTAEMFLPWEMLNMPAADDERRMAIEIARFLARKNEVWSWPALPSTEPRFISIFQPIALSGVAPRQEVSLFPYAAYGNDIARGVGSRDAGLDVFWRPSPAFFLSASINPDFGQVEADNVVVNLSAFETFFPEKRLFFLESQDVFHTRDFGYGVATTLLHTRRLGAAVGSRRGAPDLDDEQRYASYDLAKPVDLLLAAKAVGQTGRSRYGALVAAEADTRLGFADGTGNASAQGRDFGVFRYQFEDTADGGRKAIGWLGTVSDHPARRATAQSVDAHYRTPSGAWNTAAQLMTSDIADERGWGGLLDVINVPRTGDQHYFHLAAYDDALDLNDLGYLQRNGFTRVFYEFWRRRQDYESIRDTDDWYYVQAAANSRGQLINGFANVHQGWGFNNNTGVDLDVSYSPPYWDDRDSRGHGTFKLPSTWGVGGTWRSPSDRKLGVNVSVGWSREPMGGDDMRFFSFLNYSPADRIRIQFGLDYQTRDSWLLWQGGTDFTTFASEQWSSRIGVGVFFTARQHLQFALQWVAIKAFEADRHAVAGETYLEQVVWPADEPRSAFAISDLVLQARYRWQIAPMSDLFVVYNRTGGLPDSGRRGRFTGLLEDSFSTPGQEGILLKLRYRFGL